MPNRSALFEVQFFSPDEFLAELKQDLAENAVEGNIVRLTHSRRPTRNRVNYHSAHFIEATYTTSHRNQLVRLSHYCGFASYSYDMKTPRLENEPTKKCLEHANQVGTKVKLALLRLGLDIRAGGLFIEGYAEPADDDHSREPITDEIICEHCGEPIYFANEAWRHQSDKRAGRTRPEKCTKCDGNGRVTLGTASVNCSCLNGIRQIWDHNAEPREPDASAAVAEPEEATA